MENHFLSLFKVALMLTKLSTRFRSSCGQPPMFQKWNRLVDSQWIQVKKEAALRKPTPSQKIWWKMMMRCQRRNLK